MIRFLVFLAFLFHTSWATAQTLDESIEIHKVAVDQAKQKVVDKFQAMIIKAEEKGDSARSGKLREFSQYFINKGVIFVPEDNMGILGDFKEYGGSIKTAGDALRTAYLNEIKVLNAQQDIDGANSLLIELESRVLPAKLVSLQLATAPTQYVNHWDLLIRGNKPVKDGERLNATFELRAGLSNQSHVSIHSVGWPTAFVDHLDYRIRLTDSQESAAWKEHATWIQTPGLSNKDGFSFKSVTHPNRYIRIRENGEAWLDEYQDNLAFKREATFFVKPGLCKLW